MHQKHANLIHLNQIYLSVTFDWELKRIQWNNVSHFIFFGIMRLDQKSISEFKMYLMEIVSRRFPKRRPDYSNGF